MSPISERAQELANYVLDEVEHYRSGEIDRFSTNRELGERFGYKPGGVSSTLSGAGLSGVRRNAVNERRGTWFSETRGEELKEFVREEIDRVKAGEIDKMSSMSSLSQRFGYASNTGTAITFHLQNAGLLEERRSLIMHLESETPQPSEDLAWIIGVLSGGHWKGMSTSSKPELANQFKRLGENLFRLNATDFDHTIVSRGRTYEMRSISFPKMRIVKLVGDLSRSEWVNTILDRHEWLFKNPKHVWRFLEGYLEVSGSVDTGSSSRSINFYTRNIHGANLIIDLLTSVGAERPRLSFLQADQNKLRGVSVRNLRDISLISENVHSFVPGREEKLEIFRGLSLEGLPTIPSSVEDVINEWVRIRQMLGRIPTSKDINRLKAKGLTRYSHMVYANRMGSGRFSEGRTVIEDLIRDRRDVKEYAQVGKLQPKVYSDEEIIQEWGRLADLLGRSPNTKDIERMKKRGQTRFSASLYIDRFGDGSYIQTREILERIIAEQAIDKITSNSQSIQVFPEE